MMGQAEPADLVKYGLIPEFVGRFPILTRTRRLSEEQLKAVLTEPKNALLKQYRYLFALNNVDFVCTDGATREIARLAIAKRTGARALRNILENMLLEAMFQAPDEHVARVVVDAASVLSPRGRRARGDAAASFYSAETGSRRRRGRDLRRRGRGDATRRFRGDGSRRRHVEIPRRRVAAPPRPRRGDSAETSRGDAAAVTRTFRGDESRRCCG